MDHPDQHELESEKPMANGRVIADVDAALQYIGDDDTPPMTAEDEKRLVRKIDLSIVPLMFGCYFLQYLDKTLINYANIMGLKDDTHISGDQFSQLALVFYVTYLGFEFPTGYLMQVLPTAKYLGVNVACWGLMVACTAKAGSWGGLVSLRVLLGCFEAAVAPALILITSMWYKTAEQPRRVGFWYIGTGVAKMVGAVTSFGFQHYRGHAFKSWEIMFLVYGLLTIFVGIIVFFFMPDSPMASRLSETEKKWAIARLRENRTGVENKHFKRYQVIQCICDPQTWLLFFAILSSNIPNGFISTYSSTVIKTFGFSSEVSSLMSIPSGAVDVVCVLISSWLAGKYNIRGPFAVGFLTLGILGSCLLAFLPTDGYVAGKMVGNYLTVASAASLPLMYSFAAANHAGHTKKVTMNALVLIGFCIGNIIGPLTFQDKDKPEYISAKIAMVVTNAFGALCMVALLLYYRWENRRRDRLFAQVQHVQDSGVCSTGNYFDYSTQFKFLYPLSLNVRDLVMQVLHIEAGNLKPSTPL
ncbi:allantoate permease [Aspergillus varians]